MSPRSQQQDNQESPVPAITDEEIRRAVVRCSRDIADIRAGHQEIMTALIGNDIGTEGIVPRLEKVEKKSTANEKLLAVVTGALLLFVACVVFISDLRNFLFH